jgi:protein arginine kinase activator
MICNLCGKHHATIYFKGMVNDQTLKLHLCESCAKKKGLVFPFGKSIAPLSDMLSSLAKVSAQGSVLFGTRCEGCGLTYAEFKQTSQLGCSRCYATFAPLIGPLLQRIHGSSQHVGKTSRVTVRALQPVQELAHLKLELREAVKKEAYEEAARLRDQIRQIEHRVKSPR